MSEITTKAVFRRKENEIEAKDCVIDKVIRLSGAEFDSFSRNMLREWDFIRDNRIEPSVDTEGRYHCLLVTGEGRRDGILVNSDGGAYARHSAFIPNAETWLAAERYPALADLTQKLERTLRRAEKLVAEEVLNTPAAESVTINIDRLGSMSDIDFDYNHILLDTVIEMIDGLPGTADSEIDGQELIIYRAVDTPERAADTQTLQTASPLEVLIQNAATPETDKVSGAWLTLPASVGDLLAAFKEAGVQPDGLFRIAEVTSPWDNITSYLSMSDSLDELNMLASFLRDMEDFEIDKFLTLLSSGHSAIPRDAAGLINMLYEVNFKDFEVIDAADFEALGRHWVDEKPERFSFEEYGRILQRKENGVFVDGSYVYFKYKGLESFYNGSVPEEYRITDAALQGLNPIEPMIPLRVKQSDIDAYGYETAKWLAAVNLNPDVWREDTRHRQHKSGSLYYLGGESGHYMHLANDGKVTVGCYEHAKPGIADAVLEVRAILDMGSYESAVLLAAQLGGSRFLSDLDGMTKYTPPETAQEKPSVMKQIREAKAAPKQPRKAKTPDKHRDGEEL